MDLDLVDEPFRSGSFQGCGRTVARPRLLRALDRTQPGGVGLLVAPAGSGKSVLLDQWITRSGVPACRLQITSSLNDPVVFARELTRGLALVTAGRDLGLSDSVTPAGPGLGEQFVTRLLAGLDDPQHEVVLALDDLHQLGNDAIHRDLHRIIEQLPENVKVFLSTRWDPPLRFQRLRLQSQLIEIRAGDLAFDADEGGSLLGAVSGKSLTSAQIDHLVARTDGWAAGLQLAAISLQGTVDPDAFINGFNGTTRLIAEYLAEEVIDDLDPDVRRFLLDTSILEWLSPELCNAVTGRTDAQEILQLLANRSLFLVHPGDAHPLRYHHLFADLLRDRLRTTEGPSEPHLRRRAAVFLRNHGHLADAIEQLLAAGDGEDAVDLINERGQGFFEREETATVARWLTTALAENEDMPVTLGINLLAAQLASHDTGSAVETYRRLRRRSDLDRGEVAAAAALYSCLGLNDLPSTEVHRSATEAIELLRTTAPVAEFLGIGGRDSVEFLASSMDALAWLHDGELERSVRGFEGALELPGAQYRLWKVFALGGLSLSLSLAGRARDARGHARTAIAFAEASGIAHHHGLAYSHIALARVSLDECDLDSAAFHLCESEQRVLRSGRAALRSLQQLLQIEHLSARLGPRRTLQELRSASPVTFEPAFFAELQRAQELQLFISSEMFDHACALIDSSRLTSTLLPAIIELELATGDLPAARCTLDQWPIGPGPHATIERLLGTAAVLSAEGRAHSAAVAFRDALAHAESECLRRPFLAHRATRQLLFEEADRSPRSFARSILDGATADRQIDKPTLLIEPLTDREREIVDFLPTRMSNAEIASQLYVSVNTLKSHLRHIYAKLAVANRDEAIARATDLGIL